MTRRLRVRLGAGGREATVDGKAPGSVERYAEVLKVVAFTPDDLEIAKGAPATRRRWLDRAAFTRQAGYLADHRVYARALKARNELLRAARKGPFDAGSLAAFDATLAAAGGRILARRLTAARRARPAGRGEVALGDRRRPLRSPWPTRAPSATPGRSPGTRRASPSASPGC